MLLYLQSPGMYWRSLGAPFCLWRERFANRSRNPFGFRSYLVRSKPIRGWRAKPSLWAKTGRNMHRTLVVETPPEAFWRSHTAERLFLLDWPSGRWRLRRVFRFAPFGRSRLVLPSHLTGQQILHFAACCGAKLDG
jgi:hypothetical protein